MGRRLSEAILGLYDAVLGDVSYEDALQGITGGLGVNGFNIFLLNRHTGDVPLNLSYGIPDDVLRDYNSHYVMKDPGIQFFISNPGHPFYYNYLHTSESEIDRTEYYAWLQRMGGARYYLAQTLKIDTHTSMIATSQRAQRIGHAQTTDFRRLGQLGAHIQRAMRLKLGISDLNIRLAAAYDALDEIGHGVCLLSGLGTIVFANAAARAMRQGQSPVWLGRIKLETNPADRAALEAAIRRAASGTSDPANGFSSMLLTGVQHSRVIAHVLPLGERTRSRLFGAPTVLVILHDPHRLGRLGTQDCMTLFELTRSEAQIALALGQGRAPADICAERGIGINTLKTHRKRIFEKVGVASQSELVRLISSF